MANISAMETFYEEVKHFLKNGIYHTLTDTSPNPESRQRVILRASKKYFIKGKLCYE